MYLSLAWRNIWRNPRRTIVLLCAVVVGVWTVTFYIAMSRGMLNGMVENAVSTLTGHMRIAAQGYLDDPVVEHTIADPGAVAAILDKNLPQGSKYVTRVRLSAIAQNARHSAGVTMVGIDPEAEAKVSFYGRAVQDSQGLEPGDDRGIIIGRALAETFETEPGKKIVLMAQDAEGDIASRAFKIRGLFKADMEGTEKAYVFVTKQAAQEMLGLGQGVSEFSVLLPEANQAPALAAAMKQAITETGAEARSWLDLSPMVRTYITIFDQYLFIWVIVVFIAMGFGIVNTTLMAVLERLREFGLLKSLGMGPYTIIRLVLTESLMLLGLGILLGNGLALATVRLFKNGMDLSGMAKATEYSGLPRIIYPEPDIPYILICNGLILILGLVVCLYPAIKAARITPVKALAHV